MSKSFYRFLQVNNHCKFPAYGRNAEHFRYNWPQVRGCSRSNL